MKKTLKRALCTILAGTGIVASLTMFSACTTNRPQVEIHISFNGESYTLAYRLYRKLAPSTVQHFIELAENGYYDGLCVHDYQADSRMYTGGYTYDANVSADGGLVEKDYFGTVSGWNLTQTVWRDEERTQPLNTVYGEFEANGFEVESGAIRETYGSLTMYYTPKQTSEFVYVQRADGNGYDAKNYQYNSANALFYISLSTSSTTNTAYCTFGELEEDSESVLDDLKEAIAAYVEDEYDGETADFAPETEVIVDENDPVEDVSGAKETQEYAVPREPIIITSVEVVRY